MSVGQEIRAVRESAGLFRREDRGVLEVSGGDRARWLQGMLSADIEALAPGPEASVAIYRLGQWRILNDAVHVLEYALQRRKRKWRKLWERRRLRLAQ